MNDHDSKLIGRWPELPFAAWRDTYATLHMYMQIIGKLRLELCPKTNQWWNVPFYVTSRGMTTSPMPYGDRTLECDFDFVSHNLSFTTSDGQVHVMALVPRIVADFHEEVFQILKAMGMPLKVTDLPCEVPEPVPFSLDNRHRSYDAEYVTRFWTIVSSMDTVLKDFRALFRGKCSPVHFFWGSFDLAVTRFSGRIVTPRADADRITRDAYDEEVSSVGFWPGDETVPYPTLYSYMAPEPPGYADAAVRPGGAYYLREKGGFYLPYDEVRRAADPEQSILDFAESTYRAGADLAHWDRAALEYPKTTIPRRARTIGLSSGSEREQPRR